VSEEELQQEIIRLQQIIDAKVKVLDLRPRDILVVKVEMALSVKAEERIITKVKKYVKNEVLVLSGGLDIEVIRKKFL